MHIACHSIASLLRSLRGRPMGWPATRSAAAAILTISAGCAAPQDRSRPGVVVDEQYTFASPEDAALSLANAASALDGESLARIFGPDVVGLSCGDPAQDDVDLQRFAMEYDARHGFEESGDDRVFLLVGADEWVFPAPIVREGSRWRFDTSAGVDELNLRRIGENELAVLEFCAEFVVAQHRYRDLNPDGDSAREFAAVASSSAGRRDGLYWSDPSGEAESPLGPRAAAAFADRGVTPAEDSPSYLGYRYRILLDAGPSAQGGARSFRDANGELTAGFALLAWPAVYGEDGVMSFLVDADGNLFQCDLGADSAVRATAITMFDPSSEWVNPHR